MSNYTPPYGQTSAQVNPFGNTVLQAGGSVAMFGGNLSHSPSNGRVYGTMPTFGVGYARFSIYGGGGSTTVLDLDQSGLGLTVAGFHGVGGAITTYSNGDTTTMIGFGTPDVNFSFGYTFSLGLLPPATFNVNITAIDPATATSIGDGLYTDDDGWRH